MGLFRTHLHRLVEYFGAHRVPDRDAHELDRAAQRAILCGVIAAIWSIEILSRAPTRPYQATACGVLALLAAISFVYRQFIRGHPGQGVALQYFFLLIDPLVCIGILLQDPKAFALWNPFLLIVVVRSGIRYGIRTLWLAWGIAVATAVGLLPMSDYWRRETQLFGSVIFMLAMVPVFFSSLVRRIHAVRALEEDRARFIAVKELVVARSAFLAKVSHELRSPLQGIVSALDVLAIRHRPGRDADDELIGRIRRSSLLLNTHLRDMLTLAKGEAGRLEMRPEPFDACSLVDSVASSAADLASDKRLELIVDVPPDPTFVVADAARIDQILTNLVINSIRYTDSGQVRLALAPYHAAARLLHFTVSDSGPGIPEAMLPTLLTPDRVLTGSERRGEGSGIGLAIVRTLVDHLGGKVEVKSEVGLGTTFEVVIPAEPVDSDDDDDETRDAPTGRVLIVDDRDDVLDALASVIDELGFECDRATSAAVAANLLASRPYDAVLLDIEMPFKGGAELADETRRGTGPNAATRFIGMSAGEVSDDVKLRFDACLGKPIDHGALRRALLGPGYGARPSQPGLWTDAG